MFARVGQLGIRRTDPLGRTTTTYDLAGNTLLEKAPANARTTYTWDFENRMTSVRLPTGVRNTMAYDPDNLRVRLDETAGTAKFRWDAQNVVAEYSVSNSLQHAYSLVPEYYGALLSDRQPTLSSVYHFDGLRSSRATTDSTGTATNKLVYRAFGGLVFPSASPANNRYLFLGSLGYAFDVDSGIYYIRRRHYGVVNGRWLSQDPLIQMRRPASIFPYVYCRQDPIGLMDPSGFVETKLQVDAFIPYAWVWVFGQLLQVKGDNRGLSPVALLPNKSRVTSTIKIELEKCIKDFPKISGSCDISPSTASYAGVWFSDIGTIGSHKEDAWRTGPCKVGVVLAAEASLPWTLVPLTHPSITILCLNLN